MENRHGLVVEACRTQISGHAELTMIERHADRLHAVTLGADKSYDAAGFVNELSIASLELRTAVRLHLGLGKTERSGCLTKSTWCASAKAKRKRLYTMIRTGKRAAQMLMKARILPPRMSGARD